MGDARDRPDPVGILEEQNATRVPELVPIRHGRMIVSPFTFYRGGAAIMAWDLSRTADDRVCASSAAATRTCRTSACSPRPIAALVFDLNDFDETLPAPFEWDVKRLAASFVVAARDNGHRPKDSGPRRAPPPRRTGRRWPRRRTMRFLDVWYSRIDVDKLIAELAPTADKAAVKSARKALAKAQHADEPRLAGEVRASRSTAATGSSSSRR